ncbi:PaaI family thioesterase [Paracoccus jiaweipingae]|uniref:PaaI family thioesterase n=1 Tax=unclassified Paracoccus (in: a-proteobacteria) TaxID=2688777 RepID=UPI00378F7930
MPIIMDQAALNAFLARDFPEAGPGFSVTGVSDDGISLRLDVGPDHLRPGGTVSGPAMFALADLAIYLAILSRIGPVALAVTTNASMDFMRKPAAGAALRAEARLLKLGRVLAVADALIFSEGVGEPVARAAMTYSIPPR